MIGNPNDIAELHQWYEWLQRTEHDSKIIAKIQARICLARDNNDLAKMLRSFLATEYRRQKKYGAAEQALLELAAQFPDDPTPLISLAEQKLYFEREPEKALEIADRALERACTSGNFRRQAMGVKARIAISLKRYDLVEDVLRTLLDLEYGPGNVDIGVERDFLDRLPTGAVDPELADRYDRFSQSQ
jgi:hypothetical protein